MASKKQTIEDYAPRGKPFRVLHLNNPLHTGERSVTVDNMFHNHAMQGVVKLIQPLEGGLVRLRVETPDKTEEIIVHEWEYGIR